MADDRVVLSIGRSDSHCGACGKSCLQMEKRHEARCGYDQHEGCGARYTHVLAVYTGTEDRIREMRPDLTLVGSVVEPVPPHLLLEARDDGIDRTGPPIDAEPEPDPWDSCLDVDPFTGLPDHVHGDSCPDCCQS